MTTATDDEARWAEAQSLLDRMPTESAEQRLRRWRTLTLLFVLGVALVGGVIGLGVFLLVDGGAEGADDGPVWREVTGLVVATLGLVLTVIGLVVQIRGNRRLGVWRNPLAPLTRRQRKELVGAVRRSVRVQPDRVPLARYTAELLVHQRTAMVGQVGFFVLFAGQWITWPTGWRLTLAVVLGVVLVAGGAFMWRDVARARGFLAAHPEPDARTG